MQNDCMNVNSERRLTAQECEILLCAEIEATARGMQDGLQLFADMRDRNILARNRLASLHDGRLS